MKSVSRGVRLTAAVIVLMFSGIIYAWSNIKAPLEALGIEGSALSFNYTLTIWFFCIGGLVSGFLAKWLSAKVRMILSAAMLLLGFFITSFLTENSSPVLLYLSYGFLAGTGIGIVYNAVIATVTAHFADKKGFCSGAMMMGFGIGSFIIGLIAANLLKSAVLDWRTLYRLLGLSSGVIIFIGSYFIAPPESGGITATSDTVDDGDISTKDMVKRLSFWKIFIFFVLFSAIGSSAIALTRDISGTLGIAEGTAILIASLVSVTNSVGRLVSGALFDALGLRKTQFVTSAIAIVSPLLALVGILLGSTVLATAGVLLCGLSYGFSPTVSAALTMEFYGKKYYGSNLGVINLVLIPGAFVPTIASSMSAGGSFTSVFIMLTVFSLVGAVINATIKKA